VIKPAAGYQGPLAYSSPEAVQTTGTVAENAGDAEFGGELLDPHRNSFFEGLIFADRFPTAPSQT
jgi:hypothetical protein